MCVKVLALDLERTLIDDALSARPRPRLRNFLTFCDQRFERVVLFTTVDESSAREVMEDLDRRGYVPRHLLALLEYVDWTGEYKDLRFVPDVQVEEVFIVDDDVSWIRPDQRAQWIAIAPWDGGPDDELLRIESVLTNLADGTAPSGG